MKVTVRGDREVRAMLQGIGRQAPFALAVALNGTANAVQQAVRGTLAERFTLRRKTFIEQTIYRSRSTDFATKAKPQAIVRIHPDRDVLEKFEDGNTKRPRDGRSIAIPTANARRSQSDIVTKANRPRVLLDKPGHFRVGDVLFKATGKGKRRKRVALFVFIRSARTPQRLGMRQTAARVVPEVWEREASAAIQRAIATAR